MNKLISQLKINGTEISAPGGISDLSGVTLDRIVQVGVILIIIAGVLAALFYLIQGGIQWTVSGGEKQRIEQARLKIVYAIVGLILVLGSFGLLNLIFGFFNLSPAT